MFEHITLHTKNIYNVTEVEKNSKLSTYMGENENNIV